MTAPHGIGHNSRQDFDGYSGRLHQWRKARRDLLGAKLPLEVVRLRVRRAAALGLDYGTYASVRAGTGRDIVALLFSSNALRMIRTAQMTRDRAAKLAAVAAERGVLVHAPGSLVAKPPLDWADRAPGFADSWRQTRARLVQTLRDHHLPPDAVLMIGDTAFEASWCPTARAAGYVSADRYFGDAP
ncbi:hypothetical protein [Jannaschia sp. 2305UL9-9]|uniref:hypothetical protein n=1 Tax=Jannaschia sp. 2305UL9-9 TaxID=3121638 RepID=UPI003528BA89